MIRAGLARVLALLATIVRVVCSGIGALIVIHAVFVFFEANPSNVLVQFTAGIRDNFGWFTKNLFTPKDPKIAQATPPKATRKEEAPRAAPVRQTPPSQKPAEQPRAQEEPTPEPVREPEPVPDSEPDAE